MTVERVVPGAMLELLKKTREGDRPELTLECPKTGVADFRECPLLVSAHVNASRTHSIGSSTSMGEITVRSTNVGRGRHGKCGARDSSSGSVADRFRGALPDFEKRPLSVAGNF
jgi:hypothetical protein